jgi:aspartate/methionine/tyrosine aminotransferase
MNDRRQPGPRLNPRLRDLPPSGTMAVSAEIRRRRERGIDVINLGGGLAEPGPACLLAPFALDPRRNVGGDPAGELDLRKALAEKLRRDQGLDFDPAGQIVITTGAKQAILPTLLAMLEAGDDVLLLDPSWVSYAPAIQLAGGVPKPVSLLHANGFRLDSAVIEAQLTPRSRAIIINNPHNPTGRVFTAEELAAVAAVAIERNLWVISDESFDKFVFDGRRHLSIATLAHMRPRTVVVQSFSKAFALPGARVGYLAGPAALCEAVIRFNEHVITCASPLMQSLALSVLADETAWTTQLLDHYRMKRQTAHEALCTIAGLQFTPTEGTFYAFANIKAHSASSAEFAARLLDRAGVAVTPGIAFGRTAEGFVRINLVGPLDDIREGLRRMRIALDQGLA